MLGALLGDIVGSVYEHSPIKFVDFELFHPDCRFTDETVLTIAIANALARNESYQDNIRTFAKTFENVSGGYGSNFKFWIYTGGNTPYHSLGVGPAARVSPIGWAFEDLQTTLTEAEKSARATHDHPEAIKGALAIAHAIFMARKGFDSEAVKNKISETYTYQLDRPLAEVRAEHTFDASAPVAVPLALSSVFQTKSTEEAIRAAVSLGGDSDTLASLAGAVAEALYGIPDGLKQDVLKRLPETFLNVMAHFREMQSNNLSAEQRGHHAA